uniref:Copper-fist domain-containing protein n=1 Tax=Panagrellus redivivus TaxID=6233 RepID=A0A7E4URN5_PANRE
MDLTSVSTSETCTFCKGCHNSNRCCVYKTAASRQQRLKEQHRCNRCLGYGHNSNCTISTFCRYCNKRSHHELVCNLNAKNEDWCTLCDTHFNSNECQVYETHSKRAKRVTLLKLCKLCLTHHGVHRSCSRYDPCAYCDQQNHHKVLCRQNPYLKENRDHILSFVNCIFCSNHSDSGICPVVRDLETRKAIIKEQRRCEKCMRRHPTENCFYRNRCKVCSSPEHHDVICPNDKTLTKRRDLLTFEDDDLPNFDIVFKDDGLKHDHLNSSSEDDGIGSCENSFDLPTVFAELSLKSDVSTTSP